MNEQELQRLIDGELDSQATRRLLKSIDPAAETWRTIATAFVEDRLWQQSFQQFDSEASLVSPAVRNETPSPAAKNLPQYREAAFGYSTRKSSSGIGSKLTSPHPATTGRSPSWSTLAAGLLLAAGLGFYFGRQPAGTNGSGPAVQIAETGEVEAGMIHAEESDPKMTLASVEPEYELELTDANGIGRDSIPLYSVRELKQLSPATRRAMGAGGLSPAEQDRLRAAGYRLQQNVDFLSGRLKDGRTFFVPVQTVNLSSGQ